MLNRFLGLTTIIAVFGMAASAHAGEKLMMGRPMGLSQLPSLVAQAKGFFKEQGLDVEYKWVARGNVALGAMAAGNLQFAESAHAPFLAATAKGVPFVAVGIATRGFTGKVVAAPRNANLKTLADFKGKHLGVQVGTGVHTVMLMLMKRKGLNPKDFNITNVRTVDMPAAMAAPGNKFDAVIGWEPGMTRIVRSGHGKIIIEANQLEKDAQITYPFLLSTTKKFRDEHPDTVQKVLNVYSKANKYIREHHDEAVKIFTEAAKTRGAKLTEDLVKIMLFDTDRFGGSAITDADMKDLTATRAFLTKIGKLKSPPPLDSVIDRSFGKKSEMALMN